MRSYFWPFTEVQNGNQREVMTKCGNFFSTEKQKAGKTLFGSTGKSLDTVVVYPPRLAKAFGVAFCYKDCFGEPHLRLRSAMARRLDDCRGSRVGCFREIAGGTPATTALLWREGGDVHTKKRF